MDTKQIALVGGAVAAVSKFYLGHEAKTALILAAVAAVAVGMADNLLPKN